MKVKTRWTTILDEIEDAILDDITPEMIIVKKAYLHYRADYKSKTGLSRVHAKEMMLGLEKAYKTLEQTQKVWSLIAKIL